MVFSRSFSILCLVLVASTVGYAYNTTGPELAQRQQFSNTTLQFNFPMASLYSNSVAGQTYSMDLNSNPILATLPSPGFSSKVDDFSPCAIKIPHVHPRASKFSYVVSGTLQVGIAEEDSGRVMDFNVSQGAAIVIPQGLIHYMKNNNCTSPLKMLTVFNNVDSGELTLLDKVLAFPEQNVLASTGLDQASVDALRNSLPQGPGDLRIDPICVQMCGASFASASPIATAG